MITSSESSLTSVVSEVPVTEVPVTEVVIESTTPVVLVSEVVSEVPVTEVETVVAKPAKAKKATKKKPAKAKAKKAAKKSSKKTAKKEKNTETEPVVMVATETEPVVETALAEMVATETVPVVKAGPGRPHRYTGDVEKSIVALYAEVGTVLQTREILIAANDSELSNKRDKSVIPNPLTISMPCLTSLLKRAGIAGRGPGRPKIAVAETVTPTTENVEAVEAIEPETVSVEVSETIEVISTESEPIVTSTEEIEVVTGTDTVVAA